MSRGTRDDERPSGDPRESEARPDVARAGRRPELPTDRLTLPTSERREAVEDRDRVYTLRGSETRILATVGAFRVVPATDLVEARTTPRAFKQDLQHLADQGLIARHTLPISRELTRVVVLTPDGKALLDAHRQPTHGRPQEHHAGLVKVRELAHDAQLYRLYQAEAARLEDAGGRVTRVVLDYELKRDYQTFLNRAGRPSDIDRDADLAAFAAAHGLPIIDGHLELPDLRIEYETADGRVEHRDLELVTEHYSRSQLAGKARAGFGLYRAAGAGRGRGSQARTGGTPFDPHHLERLL